MGLHELAGLFGVVAADHSGESGEIEEPPDEEPAAGDPEEELGSWLSQVEIMQAQGDP
jgi:hypothetical protein